MEREVLSDMTAEGSEPARLEEHRRMQSAARDDDHLRVHGEAISALSPFAIEDAPDHSARTTVAVHDPRDETIGPELTPRREKAREIDEIDAHLRAARATEVAAAVAVTVARITRERDERMAELVRADPEELG